ncbi:helix-turn-helix domain-containing protein [Mycobacterium tuberculosis]
MTWHNHRRVSEHDAWLTLSGSAIKMLTVMAGMKRNALGYIEASVSECSKASGLSRSAASRALIDLRKAGLLRAAPLGSFDNKHVRPSIWLITL